jgi:hypothetical protein
MQTIAEQLQAENRHPYACFFFNRGVVGCHNMDQLFSTLAYQLAINMPSMREHIEQAMMEDPALPRRSAATQLQKLIIIPFKLLPTPPPSLILIIDGLDECEGEESQDAFLELISKVLEDPAVTIQFIVSGLQGHEYERVRSAGGCLVLDHDSKPTVAIYLSKYTCAFFFFFIGAPGRPVTGPFLKRKQEPFLGITEFELVVGNPLSLRRSSGIVCRFLIKATTSILILVIVALGLGQWLSHSYLSLEVLFFLD